MDAVRLRVVFEDRHILTESQKSDGLKRSWLLLKPQHDTISDLSSYLTHIFDLSHSCPHGIKLSMDGFVLPPFESTCMLKDKDVIRVKRNGGILREVIEAGDGPNLIEEEKIVEKQPVATCVPLLANEEFETETGGYQSEAEEDEDNQETSGYHHEPEEEEDKQSEDPLHVDKSSGGNGVSKKRKASKELHSSKKKKKRTIVPEDIENDSQMEQNDVHNNDVLHPGKNIDKEENSLVSFKKVAQFAMMYLTRLMELERFEVSLKVWRCFYGSDIFAFHTTFYTRGNPPEKNMPNDYTEQQEQKQNGEAGDEMTVDDEIVPIVIRPGHIRFEPLGKDACQAVQQSLVSMSQQINVSTGEKSHQHPNKEQKLKEKSQWNAITGKRKGQNWGRENFASSRRNDSNGQHSELMTSERSESQWNTITGKIKGQNWGRENFASSRRNDYIDSKGQHSELMTSEKLKPSNDPIDFDRLPPLNSLPNEGDVIAYRLVELSSTWSPRLSSFRIGKTMQCDTKSKSKKVILVPVPEYPINFDKQTDEDALAQPNNSIYGEDGSLEISFLSLIDVRVVKHGNPVPAKAVTGWNSVAPIGNKVTKWNVAPSYTDKQTHAPTQASLVGSAENEVNVWDRLIQAQSAKKVQLIHVNSVRNQNSGTRSCSNGALRIGT
ncbi:sphere organelles protein-like protein [Actinidia rufa]|uniref:Sphere organelles protein-like protein n=1 Tax=Actinidia rufa TaxID=165716 RepID=A0A7J0EQB5_9ERIC|nr:sphere organelles protein-like protein [Actinidia rufa]